MSANNQVSAEAVRRIPPGAMTANVPVVLSATNHRRLVMPCPEDVAIDHEFGRVYVSSCSRPRVKLLPDPADFLSLGGLLAFPNPFEPPSASLLNGAILTFSLSDPDAQVLNQTVHMRELGAFRPVGIDLLPIDRARARLFVTDRPADGRARIIIFEVERASGALSEAVFVEDPSFVLAPNGIAAVSADAFYFTNSQGGRFHWQQIVENIIPLGFGSIVHCRLGNDGPVFKRESAFEHIPNGVAYEPVGKRLYVAVTLAKWVMVYGIVGEPDAPRLVLQDQIALPVAADNLSWDIAGNLWVAGSPNSIALMSYSAGLRDTCPSQVVRIVDPGGAARVEPMFRDDGTGISAASVGACHEAAGRRRLVVGAPYQDRLLVVDM